MPLKGTVSAIYGTYIKYTLCMCIIETNCDILHEQGIEKVLLNLLETFSAVISCCQAITALSNQLTTCKQLIGKEGK